MLNISYVHKSHMKWKHNLFYKISVSVVWSKYYWSITTLPGQNASPLQGFPLPFPLHNISGLPHNSVERERVIVLHLLLIINDDAEDNNDNHNNNNKLIIIVIISW